MRSWLRQRFDLGRDYLMFWSGQTISYIGDSLAGVALALGLISATVVINGVIAQPQAKAAETAV